MADVWLPHSSAFAQGFYSIVTQFNVDFNVDYSTMGPVAAAGYKMLDIKRPALMEQIWWTTVDFLWTGSQTRWAFGLSQQDFSYVLTFGVHAVMVIHLLKCSNVLA